MLEPSFESATDHRSFGVIRGVGVTVQGNGCSYQFLKRSKEQVCNCFLNSCSLLLSSTLVISFKKGYTPIHLW